MLLKQFYFILSSSKVDQHLTATVKINNEHIIFQGHFPGQPVVPGVCMVQIIKELLEQHEGRILQLAEADHIKFLAVIDPRTHHQLEVDIKRENEPTGIKVIASLFSGEVIFFKIKCRFKHI